ncbi:Mg/Co/Ni transporter MgtE [Loktanella ponticola]|uniref:Mg/Co/Ni transporter MgtE n=1 Tax=Yoonia ponticola TaxID=1524255 RepID=A0A7W9BHX1_9RHOB|nr:nitrate/nitrite transporter NrtS [Yoonia ponticola]MBB5720814.1 Mg/Co/Ni transporter MgtE [Yoonia ponticola]
MTAAGQVGAGFWQIATRRQVIKRAGRIALIVGVILAAINHGDRILNLDMNWAAFARIALTFCVPYAVSTYSSVLAIRESEG